MVSVDCKDSLTILYLEPGSHVSCFELKVVFKSLQPAINYDSTS